MTQLRFTSRQSIDQAASLESPLFRLSGARYRQLLCAQVAHQAFHSTEWSKSDVSPLSACGMGRGTPCALHVAISWQRAPCVSRRALRELLGDLIKEQTPTVEGRKSSQHKCAFSCGRAFPAVGLILLWGFSCCEAFSAGSRTTWLLLLWILTTCKKAGHIQVCLLLSEVLLHRYLSQTSRGEDLTTIALTNRGSTSTFLTEVYIQSLLGNELMMLWTKLARKRTDDALEAVLCAIADEKVCEQSADADETNVPDANADVYADAGFGSCFDSIIIFVLLLMLLTILWSMMTLMPMGMLILPCRCGC
eukprot:6209908-Pleurochrysis_carterae.AAC.1